MEVEGVTNVRLASLTQKRNQDGTLASLEIDTAPGYNNEIMAQALFQKTYTEAIARYGSGKVIPFDFSVILWDGQGPAIDWRFDNGDDLWHQTELSITPSP